MKKILGPYVAKALSSDALLNTQRRRHELIRRMKRQPHQVDVYLRIDDPYSFLLVQVLPDLLKRFDIRLSVFVVAAMQEQMYPRLQMLKDYAQDDARALARLYGLSFPARNVALNEQDKQACSAAMVGLADGGDLEGMITVFQRYWLDRVLPEPLTEAQHKQAAQRLEENDQRLEKQGHYLGAMMFYGGEWYWGLDRLDHLERRLIDLGCARHNDEKIRFDRTYRLTSAPQRTTSADASPLTLFWSARSPYSYIALVRTIGLAQQYEVPLEIKPVLPMMMRNMFVPDTKKMYIFHDTRREAKKLGIPYGFVADPLGAAVERCYALLDYAREAGLLEAYLLSFAYAVNAEGIRADTDKGMRLIVQRCGLDWTKAKPLLTQQEWRREVDDNLKTMLALGCWGVPTLQYQGQVFWGQDRIGLIETQLRQR